MKAITETPAELPNPNEEAKKKPEIKEGIARQISTQEEKISEPSGQPDCDFDFLDDNITKVTLSWKRNLKNLRNWMVKHMEAYPDETKYGFITKFSDDNSNKLFYVRPCHEDEASDITIKWINYRIIEETPKMDPIDEIIENAVLEFKETKYPSSDKLPEEIKRDLDTLPTDSGTWFDIKWYKKKLREILKGSKTTDEAIAKIKSSK